MEYYGKGIGYIMIATTYVCLQLHSYSRTVFAGKPAYYYISTSMWAHSPIYSCTIIMLYLRTLYWRLLEVALFNVKHRYLVEPLFKNSRQATYFDYLATFEHRERSISLSRVPMSYVYSTSGQLGVQYKVSLIVKTSCSHYSCLQYSISLKWMGHYLKTKLLNKNIATTKINSYS